MPHTVDVDEGRSGDVVRMLRRLRQREHRGDARVPSCERRGPLVARTAAEATRENSTERVPLRPVVAAGQRARVEPEAVEQLCIELRLDRTDRDVLTGGASLGVVGGRA